MEGRPKAAGHGSSDAEPKVGIYASAEDALKELADSFNYWSGQVTTTSVQMCYAVIGANWVVFSSVGRILQNRWAISSLITVLVALTLNMISSLGFAEWMRRRFEKADANRKNWEKEFESEAKKPGKWPYTAGIENAGIAMRYAKVLLPLVGGALLIVGAILH